MFKSTRKAKTYRFKLKDGKLRRLKPGRYVVEVRAGTSRTRLGKAKSEDVRGARPLARPVNGRSAAARPSGRAAASSFPGTPLPAAAGAMWKS